MQKRKLYIDVLRVVATIGVIFIHVSSNNWYGNIGEKNWIIFSVYEGFFKLSVPIFFMISGCLFLNSDKNRSIKSLFSHSIFRMVVFLIFWSIVYKILEYTQYNISAGSKIKNMIIEILKGDTQTHLWFVYAIIGLYMLVPLLQAFVKKTDRKTFLYIIIVCFVLGTVCDFTAQFSCLEIITNNIIKVRSGFSVGYIGYFLLGAYIDKYDVVIKNRIIMYILGGIGICISISLVMWDCIYTQTLNERFWSYTMPGIYFASGAVFMAIKKIKFKDGFFIKAISDISEKSLGIYGVHFLFIILFWKWGFSTFLFSGILSVPVISIIVFVCSYISSTAIKKIPIIGKYIA